MHFITMDSVTEKYTNIWDNVIIMVLYLPGKAERFLMTPFLTHDYNLELSYVVRVKQVKFPW